MKSIVTVYITNYNYGSFLERSIQSVLNQSYKKIFLIIIDDNSEDNSKKILEKYRNHSNVKIFINKKNKGLIKCANFAIKKSIGKFILRLDADDYLSNNAIKLMVNKIKNKKNTIMVFPNFYNVNEKSIITSQYSYKHKLRYNLLDKPAHGACSLINIKFLKKIGSYKEVFDRQDGHYLWYSILCRKKNICHINKSLFYLKWQANLDYKDTIRFTSEWYYDFYISDRNILDKTLEQITEYENMAKTKDLKWTE